MSRDPVETYLMPLIEAGCVVGDVPLLDSAEWAALDRHDPRSTAAVARAALVHHLDGRPEAIAARLRRELADVDLYIRYRFAEASHDVSRSYTTPRDLVPKDRSPAGWIAWYESNAARWGVAS